MNKKTSFFTLGRSLYKKEYSRKIAKIYFWKIGINEFRSASHKEVILVNKFHIMSLQDVIRINIFRKSVVTIRG